MHVVDQTEEWSFLGRRRPEAQHGEAENEWICGHAFRQSERDGQRGALRAGKASEPVAKRHAQLMQCGEREAHLRLHGRRGQHSTPRRTVAHLVQEGSLADT